MITMALFITFGVVTGPALGQVDASTDMRSLIVQALSEPGGFTIRNKTLAEAIDLISKQTGLRLVMSGEVMNLAPLGPNTLIEEVEIANMPLREGLERMFAPLGMTFLVRDDHVEILAKECLRSLGRPITWEELDTLAQLVEMRPGQGDASFEALRSRLQFHVPFRNPWSRLAAAMRDVGAGAGDEVLTRACRNLGWVWSLSGETIVVTAAVVAIRGKLSRPIKLRMTNRPLLDVMRAVGKRIGVAIHSEPGLIASLPPHLQQNFTINVHHDPASQVLDTIAAYTGLGYVIEPEGIFFFNPRAYRSPFAQAVVDAHPPTGTKPPASAHPSTGTNPQVGADPLVAVDPVVAKITVTQEDGKTIDWLIRRSELPEDLRRMRENDLQELFDSVRRSTESRQP